MHAFHEILTLYKSAASFSMYCFNLSAVFKPSWKKLWRRTAEIYQKYKKDMSSSYPKIWEHESMCSLPTQLHKTLINAFQCFIKMHQQADSEHYLTRAGSCHVNRGNYSRHPNTEVSCAHPSLHGNSPPGCAVFEFERGRHHNWWNIMRMN